MTSFKGVFLCKLSPLTTFFGSFYANKMDTSMTHCSITLVLFPAFQPTAVSRPHTHTFTLPGKVREMPSRFPYSCNLKR